MFALQKSQKGQKGHSFSTYAKFSKKLTFLTTWYTHVRVSLSKCEISSVLLFRAKTKIFHYFQVFVNKNYILVTASSSKKGKIYSDEWFCESKFPVLSARTNVLVIDTKSMNWIHNFQHDLILNKVEIANNVEDTTNNWVSAYFMESIYLFYKWFIQFAQMLNHLIVRFH